jgi:hypothetical protein
MKYKFLLLLLLTVSLLANVLVEENSIGQLLHNDEWQLVRQFEDGVRLYEKSLNTDRLKAYRVETETTIAKEKLLQAFENVEAYETVLKSAGNITFDTIETDEKIITAYQHIEIPLLNDRHYTYKMVKNDGLRDYSYWQLIEMNDRLKSMLFQKHRFAMNAVPLNNGAGVYRVIETNESNIVQYSLYLDPAGNIPGFLANAANKNGLVNMFRDLLQHSENK